MKLRVKALGQQDYTETWTAMGAFTDRRDKSTPDEVWLVEHPPVYTLGRNGDSAHILRAGAIPVVASDRGGQVTYHGPGQLIAYTLLDLGRLGIGVKSMVHGLEQVVVRVLSQYGILSAARADAPGVYVREAKIASLGLRVRNACCFHGLSLNVAMDLSPFENINPCGHPGLRVTSMAEQGADVKPMEVAAPLIGEIVRQYGYAGVVGVPLDSVNG